MHDDKLNQKHPHKTDNPQNPRQGGGGTQVQEREDQSSTDPRNTNVRPADEKNRDNRDQKNDAHQKNQPPQHKQDHKK